MIALYKHALVKSVFFLLFAMVLWPHEAPGEMRRVQKIAAGTPPYTVMQSILKSNQKYTKSFNPPTKRNAPLITWLTSPDVRLQGDLILQNPYGKIFNCRNLGAQLDISLAEVTYGVRHLHTPFLLITLDSDNWAIQSFMKGYERLDPVLRRNLDHLHLPMQKSRGQEEENNDLIRNIETVVDFQVDQAVALYKDRISLGRLHIIGSIADFENRYGHGHGRLIITNINGERDPEKLKRLQVMTLISPTMRDLAIARMPATKNAPSPKE